MSLEDLKKRATASELTLIEAVEKSLRADVIVEVKRRLSEFVSKNPPMIRESSINPASELRDCGTRLEKYLNPETP